MGYIDPICIDSHEMRDMKYCLLVKQLFFLESLYQTLSEICEISSFFIHSVILG